jgi:TonB family protein
MLSMSLILAAAPQLAAVQRDARLTSQPGSNWVLSDDAVRCTVQRNVIADVGRVTVGFQTVPLGKTYRLLVFEALDDKAPARWQKITIRSANSSKTASAASAPLPDLSGRLVRADLPRGLIDSAGSRLVFELGRGVSFDLTRADVESGRDMLRNCEAQIVSEWGIDAAQLAVIATPPEAIEQSTDPLPFGGHSFQDVSGGAVQTVIVLNDIGKDGRVRDCKVVESSRNPGLDAATCRIFVDKVRYRPARNSANRPVHSWITAIIDWTLTD